MMKMDHLAEKISLIVKQHLDGELAEPERLSDGKLVGHIVSPRFRDVDHGDRSSVTDRLLRQHLTAAERKQISMFLHYTPEEWDWNYDPDEPVAV